MITCFIVSDTSTVEVLSSYAKNLSLSLTGIGSSLNECLSDILFSKPDIIYVDISFLTCNMAQFNLLKQRCSIVILSDKIEDAYEAFEYHAFDYMLKPIVYQRFINGVEKHNTTKMRYALNFQLQAPVEDAFFIKVDAKGLKEIRIKYEDLIFIEAKQNYVMLYLENGTRYLSYNTMKEMEENLPPKLFVRIHKSYIINDSKITSIEGNMVCLKDNDQWKINIGGTYKKTFLDKKDRKVIRTHK